MVIIKKKQVEELSPREEWQRRIRPKDGDPWGIYTTLGHAYSIILEKLAQNGLNSKPEPQEFLRKIGRDLEDTAFGTEIAIGTFKLNFNSKTYYPEFTRAIDKYMKEKGLDDKSRLEIRLEIIGNTGY